MTKSEQSEDCEGAKATEATSQPHASWLRGGLPRALPRPRNLRCMHSVIPAYAGIQGWGGGRPSAPDMIEDDDEDEIDTDNDDRQLQVIEIEFMNYPAR